MTIRMRYFAAAADAAGTREETVELAEGTVADLRTQLLARHSSEFGATLQICALLVNGTRAADDTPLPSGDVTVDVLPPFAGG